MSPNTYFQEFTANTDQNTAVKHYLLHPITANFIRIQPLDWELSICLRFEVYGCYLNEQR